MRIAQLSTQTAPKLLSGEPIVIGSGNPIELIERKDTAMTLHMNQTSRAVAFVAALALVAACAAASKADDTKGSIAGKISASGVRSPENVLVYIDNVPGNWPPPKKPAAMDQVKLVFTPRVLPIVKGTTVRFLNSDPILHNVFWPKNKSYRKRNLGTWGKGGVKRYTFKREGEVVLLCNVHPEMEGHIVILQNPFFAVVGKDGTYEIKNVPAGCIHGQDMVSLSPRSCGPKSAKATVSAGKATQLDFSLSRRR